MENDPAASIDVLKLYFDPKLDFQDEAINLLVVLFEG